MWHDLFQTHGYWALLTGAVLWLARRRRAGAG
jgi:hypothetical protein